MKARELSEVIKPASRRGEASYTDQPGPKTAYMVGAAERILGHRKPLMDSVLKWMERMNTDRAELFATTFAAWNDLLLAGEPVTDPRIIEDVREHWHEKKQRFDPARIKRCIAWLKKQSFAPTGHGPRTTPSAHSSKLMAQS